MYGNYKLQGNHQLALTIEQRPGPDKSMSNCSQKYTFIYMKPAMSTIENACQTIFLLRCILHIGIHVAASFIWTVLIIENTI